MRKVIESIRRVARGEEGVDLKGKREGWPGYGKNVKGVFGKVSVNVNRGF